MLRSVIFLILIVHSIASGAQSTKYALADSLMLSLMKNTPEATAVFLATGADASNIHTTMVESGNNKGNFLTRIVADSSFDAKNKMHTLTMNLYFTEALVVWDMNVELSGKKWKLRSVNTRTLRSNINDPMVIQGALGMPPKFLEYFNRRDHEAMYNLFSESLQQNMPYNDFLKLAEILHEKLGFVKQQKPEAISTFLNLHPGGVSVAKSSAYLVAEKENAVLNLQIIMDSKGTFFINTFDFISGYTCGNEDDTRRIEFLLTEFYKNSNEQGLAKVYSLLHPSVRASTDEERFKTFLTTNFTNTGPYIKHSWKSSNLCRNIRPDAIDAYMVVLEVDFENVKTQDIFVLEGTTKGFSILYYYTSIP